MMKKLILLGGGGHCKSCIDVIEAEQKYEIVGLLDKKEFLGEKILGYPFIGTDDDIATFVKDECCFLVTVGQISSPDIRKKLATLLKEQNAKLATVISPHAYVSKYAMIGEGSIIMHDALVNASAFVGAHCIINTKALVEHDVVIEDFCHISTAAVINGGTIVKSGTFFGSNAVSKEQIKTEEEAFVKAGSLYKGAL
jgi:sugar O-acyltransferase (sialic acid O-acetyltransferase NeuD family)